MKIDAKEAARLGRIGYEGYAKSTGGLTYDGRQMPTWEGLTDAIRRAWSDAAESIAKGVVRCSVCGEHIPGDAPLLGNRTMTRRHCEVCAGAFRE